eukprot:TRINITY_DN30754_c0_g1_i1.p1 TRINITY_DN30754_c0_g1~~TRINITY_DN30754_c0_g1_i1.p1  ORF type:complete len:604 (+),score=66.34 TRINITY_DN30754_c0_g1_i1:99-1910(+)
MITYDDGDWALSTIFILEGSVIYKACVWALPSGFLAVGLQYCFKYFEAGPYDKDVDVGQLANDWNGVLTTYAVAMAFLLVFRTQIAYSRLWDAISCLQLIRGTWVNCVSSCIAFCSTSESKAAEAETFKNHLVRLVSLLYCSAVTSVCQHQKQYEVVDFTGMDEAQLVWLATQPNQCEIVLQWIQRLIIDKHQSGVISAPPPILSRVFQELGNGILHLNNARRIKLVPFPFPYSQMISIILCLHVLFTVIVSGYTTQSPGAAFCRTFMGSFVFWSVNYIAIEIERPYGDDANDLPLAELAAAMNSALVNLLQERAQKPPSYEMDTSDLSHNCEPRVWRASSWARQATLDCFNSNVMSWSKGSSARSSPRKSGRGKAVKGDMLPLPQHPAGMHGPCSIEEGSEPSRNDSRTYDTSSCGTPSASSPASPRKASKQSAFSLDFLARGSKKPSNSPDGQQLAEFFDAGQEDAKREEEARRRRGAPSQEAADLTASTEALAPKDSEGNAIALDEINVQSSSKQLEGVAIMVVDISTPCLAPEAATSPFLRQSSVAPEGPEATSGWRKPTPHADAQPATDAKFDATHTPITASSCNGSSMSRHQLCGSS